MAPSVSSFCSRLVLQGLVEEGEIVPELRMIISSDEIGGFSIGSRSQVQRRLLPGVGRLAWHNRSLPVDYNFLNRPTVPTADVIERFADFIEGEANAVPIARVSAWGMSSVHPNGHFMAYGHGSLQELLRAQALTHFKYGLEADDFGVFTFDVDHQDAYNVNRKLAFGYSLRLTPQELLAGATPAHPIEYEPSFQDILS